MARPKTITDERERRKPVTLSLNSYEATQLAARGGSAYLQPLLAASPFPSTELEVEAIGHPDRRGNGVNVLLKCTHSGAEYGPYRVGDKFRVDLFNPFIELKTAAARLIRRRKA